MKAICREGVNEVGVEEVPDPAIVNNATTSPGLTPPRSAPICVLPGAEHQLGDRPVAVRAREDGRHPASGQQRGVVLGQL
jgi:hypothetical protein